MPRRAAMSRTTSFYPLTVFVSRTLAFLLAFLLASLPGVGLGVAAGWPSAGLPCVSRAIIPL